MGSGENVKVNVFLLLLLFCKQEGVFPGLIPVLNSYLENMEVDVDTRCSILNYLKLIKKRASGMKTSGCCFD